MSQCSFLWVDPYMETSELCQSGYQFPPMIWEIFSHYFLKKLSVLFSPSSPSGTHIMHIWFCLMAAHESDRFLHSLFFLLWVISNNISLSSCLLIGECLFEYEVKALYCILQFQTLIFLNDFFLLKSLFSSCIVVMILLSSLYSLVAYEFLKNNYF